MKRIVFLAGALAIAAAPAVASVVEHTYVFDAPRVVTIGDYQLVTFEGTVPAGKLGGPTLPFRGVELALPPGEAAVWVEIERADPVVLEGPLRLLPQQAVRPSSSDDAVRFLIDEAAYAGDRTLPEEDLVEMNTHFANGVAIAVGSFTPVEYVPRTGSVTYYRTVTVRVHTEPSARAREALAFLPTSERVLERVAASTDNPETAALYRPRATKQADDYDYLIITKSTYVDDFQPLADYYNRRGIRTQIQSVQWIDDNYPGTDTAARIRNYMIDEYQDHGIQWVLLGGDADGQYNTTTGKIVPYRGLYCAVQSSSLYEDEHIPSDCYFSGLDGSWNTDGDARWGEPGEEDFYGEVHVGRAAVDSESEIATFITKTTRYQDEPVVSDVRIALLLGEYLWDSPITWGADYMDELEGVCTNNGFTTQGVPITYPIFKLYDKTTGWDETDLMNEVNDGSHLVNHLGHCNTYYAMKMSDSDVTDVNFTNDGITRTYSIVYTQGCIAGGFDNYYFGSWFSDDCICECMMTINHFAAAVIANSRYGWFTEGSTNGPGQHFHREFIDALFGDGITTAGGAVTRSKDDSAPFIDLPDEYEPGAHRWSFYTSNLLGDPVMDIWTNTPTAMTVTAPEAIDPAASGAEVETGVDGALVAFSRDNTLYGRAYADGTGHAEVTFTQSVSSLDSLEMVVTAHNFFVHEETIPVEPTSSVAAETAQVDWALAPCAPNPFSRETAISFSVKKESRVSIRVFDVEGRTVARLADESRPAGRHQIVWTPDRDLAPGLYFCELRADEFRAVRKVLVVR